MSTETMTNDLWDSSSVETEAPETRAQIKDLNAVGSFLFAGKATFTLKSTVPEEDRLGERRRREMHDHRRADIDVRDVRELERDGVVGYDGHSGTSSRCACTHAPTGSSPPARNHA